MIRKCQQCGYFLKFDRLLTDFYELPCYRCTRCTLPHKPLSALEGLLYE